MLQSYVPSFYQTNQKTVLEFQTSHFIDFILVLAYHDNLRMVSMCDLFCCFALSPICSISKPFRDSLLILLSSPIYFVRRLAPRALLPFIAQSELDDFIENLLIGFPSTQEQVSHNKIHGELLLLQELINQETGNDQR